MLSTVLPASSECVPQELLPIIPPSVQRLCVEGSGPNVSWCSSAAVAQRVEHDARLHAREPLARVQLEDLVHVLREIEHDRDVAALPGEAGAGAARQHGRAVLPARRDRRDHIVGIARNHEADGDLAVVRAVGRVQRAAAAVEADFALDRTRFSSCFEIRPPGRTSQPACA